MLFLFILILNWLLRGIVVPKHIINVHKIATKPFDLRKHRVFLTR